MPRSIAPRPLAALAAALLLMGCAHRSASVPPATASAPTAASAPGGSSALLSGTDTGTAHVAQLLAYYRRIAVLPPAELQREYAAAEQAFLEGGRPEQRLRLALLLSLPDASFHNADSALRLLQGYPGRTDATDTLGNFAFFLIARASEQHNAQAQLDGAAQRAAALQRQLDGLKSIERSLNQRQIPRTAP